MVERARVTLHMGGIHAAREPTVISTVLGSCIAVCLREPRKRIGGMNHFMLPTRLDRDSDQRSACYGVYAMDLLVNELMKLGAERKRLQAKVFGAAHLLGMGHALHSVAAQNATFILTYLKTDGIPLLSYDLGGDAPRTVHFFTDTGRVLLKQLGQQRRSRIVLEERQHERKVLRTLEAPADITLFPSPDESPSRAGTSHIDGKKD